MKEPNSGQIIETDESGISFLSFAMGLGAGLALGVVGTVIFAAYSEERFGHVVRKTRSVGDKAQETAGQLKDRVTDTFGDAAEATKKHIKRISGKLEEQLESGKELVSN